MCPKTSITFGQLHIESEHAEVQKEHCIWMCCTNFYCIMKHCTNSTEHMKQDVGRVSTQQRQWYNDTGECKAPLWRCTESAWFVINTRPQLFTHLSFTLGIFQLKMTRPWRVKWTTDSFVRRQQTRQNRPNWAAIVTQVRTLYIDFCYNLPSI